VRAWRVPSLVVSTDGRGSVTKDLGLSSSRPLPAAEPNRPPKAAGSPPARANTLAERSWPPTGKGRNAGPTRVRPHSASITGPAGTACRKRVRLVVPRRRTAAQGSALVPGGRPSAGTPRGHGQGLEADVGAPGLFGYEQLGGASGGGLGSASLLLAQRGQGQAQSADLVQGLTSRRVSALRRTRCLVVRRRRGGSAGSGRSGSAVPPRPMHDRGPSPIDNSHTGSSSSSRAPPQKLPVS